MLIHYGFYEYFFSFVSDVWQSFNYKSIRTLQWIKREIILFSLGIAFLNFERLKALLSLEWLLSFLQLINLWNVSANSIIVQAITNHKFIGNFKAEIISMNRKL